MPLKSFSGPIGRPAHANCLMKILKLTCLVPAKSANNNAPSRSLIVGARPPSKSRSVLLAFCLGAACASFPALAAGASGVKVAVDALSSASDAAIDSPATEQASGKGPAPASDTPDENAPDYWTPTLLGDMGGLRPALAERGVTLGLTETSEWLRNIQGGLQNGQAYQGLTTLVFGWNTKRAGAWQGGNLYLSALQIHGRQFTPDYIGSFHTAGNIEAHNGFRLWELWYQHELSDKLDIKVGQQSLDQEFMINQYASPFVGAFFGWPALPSNDLPAGGGIYPLSSLGIRMRANLADSATLLIGAFAGDSGKTSTQDPQITNNRGTTFSLHGGTLYIAELQYSLNQGELAAAATRGLPGSYKAGVWYHNKKFADTRLDGAGLSLADPGSSGNPLQHAGNYSIYGIADQTVWRETADGARALNLFARAMAAPGDRNLVSFSANLGVTLNAPFAGRDKDVVGLGLGYVRVGSHARAFDADSNSFNSTRLPVRKSETFVEATYQYQVTPWWQLQGVVQYTRKPGGGAADSSDPAGIQRIPSSTVLGLRTNITF